MQMFLGTARKVNVAKMAEIVIQRRHTSKAHFTGLVLKAADTSKAKALKRGKARRPCFSGCAPSNVSMTIHTIQEEALARHLVRHLLQHFPFLPGSKFKPQ